MTDDVKKTPEELRKEMFENLGKNPEVLQEIAMPGVATKIESK